MSCQGMNALEILRCVREDSCRRFQIVHPCSSVTSSQSAYATCIFLRARTLLIIRQMPVNTLRSRLSFLEKDLFHPRTFCPTPLELDGKKQASLTHKLGLGKYNLLLV
ncbi:hypothetical protein AVEN_235453-1 [Araneus ventricosus]|uniref:Uncharacterized protein n=1 Tax=Araneus ventricosus TaxID=182803 RepID=A0A4Y2A5A1_ARAVE|nr:hypothetical protein AVEN_235453-1 [Araneus ventricosus]